MYGDGGFGIPVVFHFAPWKCARACRIEPIDKHLLLETNYVILEWVAVFGKQKCLFLQASQFVVSCCDIIHFQNCSWTAGVSGSIVPEHPFKQQYMEIRLNAGTNCLAWKYSALFSGPGKLLQHIHRYSPIFGIHFGNSCHALIYTMLPYSMAGLSHWESLTCVFARFYL